MSKLKEKSNFNLDAAELLINKNLYAPSVHCSYYSCFQLLKFILKGFSGKDYETQNAEISQTSQGSHNYVISKICNEITNCADIYECRNFRIKIKDLKNYRVESDYHDIEVGLDKSNKALKLAKEIRLYLEEKF